MRKIWTVIVCALLAAGATGSAAAAEVADRDALAAVDRGVSLFERGRWSDARLELLRARRGLSPEDRYDLQRVDFYLAACAVELGDPDAGAALAAFGKRYPASVFHNDVEFSLASWYCTQGDMTRARSRFAAVDYEALTPARREQYDIRMGYVEFVAGDYDAAYRHYARIAPSSEYADHALYYKSYISYSRGDYAEARRGFVRLTESDAYGALMPFYLMQIEFREGHYAYVVEQGDALIARSAEGYRADLERIVAESHFRLGDYRKAIAYLTAYTKDGGVLGRNENYLMGFSLYRTARYDEAAGYLRKACGADDELTQNASYHLADCYLRSGDKQAAMQSFAMASNDGYDAAIAEDALFNYGKLQYELGGGRFNEAINVLNRYVAKYPDSGRTPAARELLVAAYYNSRDYDAAYEAIKATPSPDANLRAAMQKIAYFRGLQAYERGDMAGAKRYLAESAAVNVSPKYTALNAFWQGEIAYAQGDYASAERQYDSYLSRAPRSENEYALAWYNIGYARFARECMPEAQEAFERFLSLRSTDDGYRADAQNRIGDTRYAARDFEAAVRSYEQAARYPEARPYAQYKRAVTLGILGRNDEKIAALREIAASGQGDYADDAAYELGRTYISREQYREGASTLERFLSDYPRSQHRTAACSYLGLAYLNLGDRKKSLYYYDKVVAAAPQSPEAKGALQGIRDIYVSQGDVDAYFAYAERTGVVSDLGEMTRDSLSFAAAQKLYLDGDNETAAKSLRSYVKSYPRGYYLSDALYYLSDCYLKSDDREEAIGSLAALVERGDTPYRATALNRLARMTYEDRRYAESAAAYRQLFDAASTAAEREEAMTWYVRATVADGDAERIAAMAGDVAAQPGAGATALRESQFAAAEQLRLAGRKAEALKIYRKLGTEVATPEGAASSYYVLEALFETGDMQKTEEALFAFAEKETPHACWLARAYLLLGDVYARKGDTFQARATYQSVADGYTPDDDGIVAEARERIEKLN